MNSIFQCFVMVIFASIRWAEEAHHLTSFGSSPFHKVHMATCMSGDQTALFFYSKRRRLARKFIAGRWIWKYIGQVLNNSNQKLQINKESNWNKKKGSNRHICMCLTPAYFFQDCWLRLLGEDRWFGDWLGVSEDVWDSVAGDRNEETCVRLARARPPHLILYYMSAVSIRSPS